LKIVAAMSNAHSCELFNQKKKGEQEV